MVKICWIVKIILRMKLVEMDKVRIKIYTLDVTYLCYNMGKKLK